MPGGGVRASNIAAIVAQTGVREVHFSASSFVDSGMRFRNEACSVAGTPPPSEHAIRHVDPDDVRRYRAARSSG